MSEERSHQPLGVHLEKKVYRGARGAGNEAIVTVDGVPLTHVVLYNPCGFDWGYGGGGPADTALSILCDFFGETPSTSALKYGAFKAARLYQFLKRDFIATAPRLGFEITSDQIGDFLTTHVRILRENDERIREVMAEDTSRCGDVRPAI